jgi:glycosyltransferase involved in cell wall biosynthesis
MARSKPIVAFDVEGVNEAVVDNQTGFLVPFGDAYGLADKIKILIDSPRLAAEFGTAAFQRVSTYFNLEINIKQLEVLYYELLRQKSNTLYRQVN